MSECKTGQQTSTENKHDMDYFSKYTNGFLNYQGFDNIIHHETTVCVTGSSGFLGSHCVKLLLLKGYNVNATVRGDPNSDKYKWIKELLPPLSNKNQLKLFKADLLKPHSFDAAIKECDYVFHVASPVKVNVNDYQKDMLEPALHGTLNVLNSCLKQPKLKRVILTSSLYAVYGIPKRNKIYDESDWDNDFTLNTQPYAYSKVESERAAWEFMKTNDVEFDLISILPSLILGAQLQDKSRLTASNQCVYQALKGNLGRINAVFPVTDVRDIAASHIFFIENEKALKQGKGRYICWGKAKLTGEFLDECDSYINNIGIDSPFPCCKMCCFCDYFLCGMCCGSCTVCCCTPKVYWQYFGNNINKGRQIATDDKIKELGFTFRNYQNTIGYTLQYFLEQQIILKPSVAK